MLEQYFKFISLHHDISKVKPGLETGVNLGYTASRYKVQFENINTYFLSAIAQALEWG